MSRYTIRVELHGAASDPEAYEKLGQAMEQEKCLDYLSLSKGRKAKLPSAEWSFTGKVTISNMMSKVKQAVVRTGYQASVVVTQVRSRVYDGLAEIASDPVQIR
jgi:hypothetical protein